MNRRRRLFVASMSSCVFGLLLVAAASGGCGARTGLAAPRPPDASVDHAADAKHDADADADVIEDAPEEDVVFPDVPVVTSCVEAGVTYIYLITEQNELYSFYPPTLAFAPIGHISCPTTATPFSMGVDRSGIAYSVFTNGDLFRISTANAACQPTKYVANQQDFTTFGMGFSGAADAGETLYVSQTASVAPFLGSIDTTSFALNVIGQFQPKTGGRCELTGTGDGRLFAFCLPVVGLGGDILQLDPSTAQILSETSVGVGGSNDAFAYAFWGGDFWLFTAPGAVSTTVTKYDPVAHTATAVATFQYTVVGAGVSTCAPE
jgi:hypothetical protein